MSGLIANAARTLTGTIIVKITGTGVVRFQGIDITENYRIIRIPGAFTIKPLGIIVNLTAAADKAQKKFIENPILLL